MRLLSHILIHGFCAINWAPHSFYVYECPLDPPVNRQLLFPKPCAQTYVHNESAVWPIAIRTHVSRNCSYVYYHVLLLTSTLTLAFLIFHWWLWVRCVHDTAAFECCCCLCLPLIPSRMSFVFHACHLQLNFHHFSNSHWCLWEN